MMMKKKIKKWGDSIVITFSPEEVEIYNLEIGKIIELKIEDVEE